MYVPRSENRYPDALATLGSKVDFKGNSIKVTVVRKNASILLTWKSQMAGQEMESADWRTPIMEALVGTLEGVNICKIKDYVPIAGELYK